jgi:CheY-like chemotaxis protein
VTTEIARLERELADARRQADQAQHAKSAFLAAMSHELKTPMNVIFGSARLLLESTLAPEQREHASAALAASEAMMTIIDDALDYSALERGEIVAAAAPFELAGVVESAVLIAAPRAGEKGLDLAACFDPSLPPIVVGDAARVRQILRKLLANAIAFTEAGSVLLRVTPGPAGGVRFLVEDTGVGVDGGTAAHLFEAFVQSDVSTTRRHGGTGLGLAICRRLAESMGGNIAMETEPGRGSRFRVDLPLAPPESAGPDAGVDRPFAGRRAIALCGPAATQAAIEQELAGAGFAVTIESTAQGVVDRLTASPGTDLLFLDLRVEDVDALAMLMTSAAISAMPQAVLVLSPTAHRQALPSIFAPSATWLTRPVLHRPLLEGLNRLFGAGAAAGEGNDPLEELGSLRILAADDYPANLRIVTKVLEKKGHVVETVTTGAAAAAAVLASHYDLVLMDCRMPEMDGYDATTLIRAREGSRRRTPIIALTANDGEAERQRCVDVGMDGFVAKPLRPADLFATVERVLCGGVRGDGSRDAQGPVTPPPPGDPWQELAQTLTTLAYRAERTLAHVDDAGGHDVRAVLRAAVHAAEIAERLRPA